MKQYTFIFEIESCPRCAGTGHYSYCQMYGTICFRCGGAGRIYTKKGAAAKAFYDGLRSKPAKDFQPGDLCYMDAGPFSKSGFRKVVEAGPDPLNAGYWRIHMEGFSWAGGPNTLLKFGLSAEQKTEFKAKALAYQESLTKKGTPRKRKEGTA